MRQRGVKYRQWAIGELITRDHSEILYGGVQLHASSHIPEGSEKQMTLVFIGLYHPDGAMIFEECYGTWCDSHAEAITWATDMAKSKLVTSP